MNFSSDKISQSLADNWIIVFIVYSVACILIFNYGVIAVNFFSQTLKYIMLHRVSWLIVFIAFGGKILHRLITKKIVFKSGFIAILTVVTEGATYGVIMESSVVFLNALVKQFLEDKEDVEIFFNADYFGNFDFLTLTFATFFLLFYSLMSAFEAVRVTFKEPDISSTSPLTKDTFEPNTNQT